MPQDPRGNTTERRSLQSEAVTVVVGEEQEKYTIHQSLLCAPSPFFTNAFKEDWKEGQQRSIPLPDDDPKVFDLYAQWLYCGRILSRDPTIESGKDGLELDLLVNAFVFGEKIQDAQFRDTTLDAIVIYTNTPDKHGTTWFPTGAAIRRAYEGTPVGSPLRRLMVDLHNYHGAPNWIKGDNCAEFLAELTREMLATRPRPNSTDPTSKAVNSCSYHLHGDDRLCYSRKS